MSDQGIYILHLSDLHVDPHKEGESKPLFDNLCKKLAEFRNEKKKAFDLLIISGDLVNQGAGDYRVVTNRIDEILAACGLSKEQVFLVPGNHDVQRGKLDRSFYRLLIQSLERTPLSFGNLEEDQKKLFLPGFEAFLAFAKQYPLLNQSSFDIPGFAQAELDICGLPLRLCGLNSAIIAGPLDDHKTGKKARDRIIGKFFLEQMLSGEDRLNLVVSHYPLSWVNSSEKTEVTERLRHAGAIYFNGHIHKSDSNVQGLQPDTQLFALGVGSLYGQKWAGQNHCQILELNPDFENPRLHEFFWFGQYGWRRFVPLEVNWPKWETWKGRFQYAPALEAGIPANGLKADASSAPAPHADIQSEFSRCGLVDIGNNRDYGKRIEYYQKALDMAAGESDLIVVGRSLIDFSLLFTNIEAAINEKNLHVKVALLDEHALIKDKANHETSWVEQPVSSDWAIRDVPHSMRNFRKIQVRPNTGSLEIYGLPFYTSHSFISFTHKDGGQRFCLEELGMALGKDRRPYVEFQMDAADSYGCTLENLYRSFMLPERLLIQDDGSPQEWDTTQRSHIILPKVEKYGLVDLGVGRESIDWYGGSGSLLDKIQQTPPNGEIFIVGRSLVAFTENQLFRKLGEAIVFNKIQCTFVLADARIAGLTSLVEGDYALNDLGRVWQTFQQDMNNYIHALMQKNSLKDDQVGRFTLYGIPTYLPETFAVYTQKDGTKYCSIEVGIGVIPQERTILYFKNVSGEDIFTYLNKIYRSIMINREPALTLP